MNGTYDLRLVALSVVVAVLASYVALDLASRVTASDGRRARYWLVAGAISMGTGIWSMHFIAMLAFRLPVAMGYSLPLTAASLVIAILASGFALRTARRAHLSRRMLVSGGVLMGIGIAAMHYVGMAAIRMPWSVHYDPALLALSIAIAILASLAALWLAFRLREETPASASWRKVPSALVMGAAICGMHYTGMAAAIFVPRAAAAPMPMAAGVLTDGGWLAAVIGAFSVALLAMTLLISLLDARRARARGRFEALAQVNATLQSEIAGHKRTEQALQESREQARAIVDTAHDAYIAIDADSVILEWNRQAEQAFGWSREEAIGQNMADLVIPLRYRDAHRHGIDRFLRSGEGPVLNKRVELAALHRDRREFPVELTIWPTQVRGRQQFHAFLHDISERRLAARRLAAQTSAATVLVESKSLDEAAPKLLQAICNALGWAFGALWTIDAARATLHCTELWRDPGLPLHGFSMASLEAAFTRGVGLPGRVWGSGQPVWVKDVAADDNFPRGSEAIVDGLHGAFGVPVFSGDGDVVAVMEFFSPAIETPDAALLGMMHTVGNLLGQFIKRIEIERALEQKEEFLTALLDNITEGIVACDAQGILTVFNDATRQLHGLPEQPLPSEQWADHYDLYLADGTTRMTMAQVPLYRAFSGEQIRDVEIVIAPRGRTRRVVVCNGRALVGRNGAKLGAVVAMHDVTGRKENERSLQQLAHFDPLTGLPNRRLFHETLKGAMAQADAQQWLVFLLFLDLDNFKDVNDSLGHAVGDELLRQVGQRLIGCLRLRDTVSRLGGDEFGVILLTPSDPQIAAKVADKIHVALNNPFEVEGHVINTSASVGITVYPTDTTDFHTMVRFADLAMYEAKQGGRNAYRFYTQTMNQRAREKVDLVAALRRALERKEFVLHYQPKVDLRSGRWTGVEALLRWQRPGHGLVPPAEFIPALEDTGLIVDVGAWVVNHACQQLDHWRRASFGPLPIAVNVSAQQMARRSLLLNTTGPRPGSDLDGDLGTLLAATSDCLREHGVRPGEMEFELTESTVMADVEHSADMLQRLKALGIQISVDDFGTGYSSLAYLRRFRLDTVKIDGAFIRDLTTNADDAAITLAIIGMAHRLNLKVIAECVETVAQLEFLRANGCDQVQGYHIARPMPVDALEALWHQTGGVFPGLA